MAVRWCRAQQQLLSEECCAASFHPSQSAHAKSTRELVGRVEEIEQFENWAFFGHVNITVLAVFVLYAYKIILFSAK